MLRALAREPATVEALLAEVALADTRLAPARHLDEAGRAASGLDDGPERPPGRRLVERLALQGSLLVRHAPAAVADAFCASRLAGDWGHAFGTLPRGLDPGLVGCECWFFYSWVLC